MNSVGYKIKKTILYILLILLGAACLFPFLLMVVNATRSGADIMTSFTLIPGDQLVNNWKTVFKFFNLFKGMANSIIVAVPATLFTAYFSALTAYGLAMYKFKGNKVLFTVILVFMMIPGQPHWFLQLMHQTASREFIPPLNIASNRSTGNRLFLKTVCALGDAAGAD